VRLRSSALALLVVAAVAPAAPAVASRQPEIRVDPGIAEHTVTAFTIERDGRIERDERVETWVSATHARVVYSDARTGEVLGACAGTRTRVSCFDRDPRLEVALGGDGHLFEPSWAQSGRSVRRALARGWLTQVEMTDHRGTAARRLTSTAAATGDDGETTILAERETLAVLFRRTTGATATGTITSTEDVLVRERLPLARVDLRLNAPERAKVRTRVLRRPRASAQRRRAR